MTTSKIVPNTFQCFNDYVDRAMCLLTDPELRCLIFAARHILGWQDRISSRRAHISLTMFERGMTVKHQDGTTSTYAGTGLGRVAITQAVSSLSKFRLLVPIGKADSDGQEWALGESPDWSALESRAAEKSAANQKRTNKARNASQKARAERQGTIPTSGVSDIPVVSDDQASQGGMSDILGSSDDPSMSDDQGGGMSDILNQSQLQSHKEKDSVAPKNGANNALSSGKTESPESDESEKPKKTKTRRTSDRPTIPAERMNPMKEAIRVAFGKPDWKVMTRDEQGLICNVAKQLCEVNYQPEQVKIIYDFLKAKNWSDGFTPGALTKYASDAIAAQQASASTGSSGQQQLIFMVPDRKGIVCNHYYQIVAVDMDRDYYSDKDYDPPAWSFAQIAKRDHREQEVRALYAQAIQRGIAMGLPGGMQPL